MVAAEPPPMVFVRSKTSVNECRLLKVVCCGWQMHSTLFWVRESSVEENLQHAMFVSGFSKADEASGFGHEATATLGG